MTSDETIKMAKDHADLAYDEKGRSYFTFDTIGLDMMTDEIEDRVRVLHCVKLMQLGLRMQVCMLQGQEYVFVLTL